MGLWDFQNPLENCVSVRVCEFSCFWVCPMDPTATCMWVSGKVKTFSGLKKRAFPFSPPLKRLGLVWQLCHVVRAASRAPPTPALWPLVWLLSQDGLMTRDGHCSSSHHSLTPVSREVQHFPRSHNWQLCLHLIGHNLSTCLPLSATEAGKNVVFQQSTILAPTVLPYLSRQVQWNKTVWLAHIYKVVGLRLLRSNHPL